MSRKALSLHFGLNYPGTSAALSGCINDARDWASLAGRLGYEPEIMEEPTKQMMVERMRGVIASLNYGDRFFCTYSGHGSRIPDADGDEADGWD